MDLPSFRTPLPPDFIDKSKWQRFKINLRVLLRTKSVKTECCQTFRKGGVACAGCATLYDKHSTSWLYRFLGRWAKRRIGNP